MRASSGKGLGINRAAHYSVWRFDSIGDMVAQSAKADGKGGSSRRTGDIAWSGTDSWQDAADMAMNGWQGMSHHLDGVIEAVRQRMGEVDGLHNVRRLDLVGTMPDVDRFLRGEIECMWDDLLIEEPHDGKVFTMIVDGTSRSDIDPADTLKRGAVLCGLVEAMNMLGYAMDIYVEHTWKLSKSGADTFHTLLCHVSHAGEPFDLSRVMFAIGHPAWNRRIAFGTAESIQEMWDRGFSHVASARGMNGCHFALDVGASIQVGLNSIKKNTNPVKWVLDQLEAQGVWEE